VTEPTILGYLPHMGRSGGPAGGTDAPEYTRIPVWSALPASAPCGSVVCCEDLLFVRGFEGWHLLRSARDIRRVTHGL